MEKEQLEKLKAAIQKAKDKFSKYEIQMDLLEQMPISESDKFLKSFNPSCTEINESKKTITLYF